MSVPASEGSVLLVEDDELIGTMVEMNLGARGFAVTWERSAEAGLSRLSVSRYDAIVLDYMLPGMDGLHFVARLRREGKGTPVLMVTVRSEVATKIEALEGGLDDYLTKPFDMDELIARVRALIRRSQSAGELPSTSRVKIAGGEVLLDSLEFVASSGERLALSEKEAHLLAMLARSGGRTLTRSDIIDEVWGMDAVPTERTVDNFILRLRRLVEVDADAPKHILTVRGRGYRYEP